MRRLLYVVLAVLLTAPAFAPVAAATGSTASQSDTPCVGTMNSPANGTTIISVQGARYDVSPPQKTQARLVAVGPKGRLKWVHESRPGVAWYYDIDPLPNGNVFVTAATRRDGGPVTVLFEFDPRIQERVWTQTLPLWDTHDADMLDRHRIAIAHMRGWNATTETNNDGLLVYNRTTDKYVQTWYFRKHYGREVGGEYVEDWSHNNDVDHLWGDTYLLSPRNFDQVVAVNASTGDIEWGLGSDDDWATLKRQHNPVYLGNETGNRTLLVADSDNDRIVEYAQRNGSWERTWRLGSDESFEWPRDADRLPNGNTLVADSRNNRVVEVKPNGEVVWEVYTPWLVYDVERVRYGDEPAGPTIAQQNASGAYALTGDTPFSNEQMKTCEKALDRVKPKEIREVWTPTTEPSRTPSTPTRAEDVGQPGFGVVGALLALLGVALVGRRR